MFLMAPCIPPGAIQASEYTYVRAKLLSEIHISFFRHCLALLGFQACTTTDRHGRIYHLAAQRMSAQLPRTQQQRHCNPPSNILYKAKKYARYVFDALFKHGLKGLEI